MAKYASLDFTPPEAVQKAAARGLALRKEYGRGGLTTQQAGDAGIGSGVARATSLSNGDKLSPDTIRQMVAFFSRHEKNKDTPPEEGNGMIAWLLWGGDPGRTWAEKLVRQMDNEDTRENLYYTEANLKPRDPANLTGREWEVTIIGAQKPSDVVEFEGAQYIVSENGRLYSVSALQESVSRWDGIEVYDNHLTDKQYEDSQGMRSQAREWLGNIVEPYFESGALPKLKGILKIVDDQLAAKLKNAWELDILGKKGRTGLSIDTAPVITREATIEGKRYPIIDGFKEILSVDLVGRPAAGGGFERLIASHSSQDKQTIKEPIMDEELKSAINAMITDALSGVPGMVKTALTEALQGEEDTEPVQEATPETPAAVVIDPAIAQATQEARLARSELLLERKLTAAKLAAPLEKTVRDTFAGKVIEEKELDGMIKNLKEAQAATDTTGRVTGAGGRLEVGMNEDDKHELELMRIIMGNSDFRNLEQKRDDRVLERVQEARGYNSWVKAGKPSLGSFGKISHLMYDWFGGDVLVDSRAYETATTSSLASVTKTPSTSWLPLTTHRKRLGTNRLSLPKK